MSPAAPLRKPSFHSVAPWACRSSQRAWRSMNSASSSLFSAATHSRATCSAPRFLQRKRGDEQRQFLAILGCHSFQGYLFSPPLPLEDFERLWLAPLPQSV